MGFRGVLFDSGDTLIHPIGGRWNPRFDFEEIVLRHLPKLAVDAFSKRSRPDSTSSMPPP